MNVAGKIKMPFKSESFMKYHRTNKNDLLKKEKKSFIKLLIFY